MPSLLGVSEVSGERHESARELRLRVAETARRIASTLLSAELANQEVLWTRMTLEKVRAAGKADSVAAMERKLALVTLAHLRECLSVTSEMKKGLADALGQCVLSDGSKVQGLSADDIKTLIEMSGAAR